MQTLLAAKTLEERLREIGEHVCPTESLTEEAVWHASGTDLWQASRFDGRPTFYPVYRWNDFYSYNPIFLIALKKKLRLNTAAQRAAEHPGFRCVAGGVIDDEIARIGGPIRNTPVITSPDQYIQAVAEGLKADVAQVERAHPGKTNVILCGGKDSLNLLLLPWRNPVVAYSARPNYELVRQFVAKNRLPIDVHELEDRRDEQVLRAEVLANCCRMDLVDCRWTAAICEIAERHAGNVIVWKGQLADTFLTPYWRSYFPHRRPYSWRSLDRIAMKMLALRRRALAPLATLTRSRQSGFFHTLWVRGAMWQGVHMSIIRAVADVIVLGAYHGESVQRAVAAVDLSRAVKEDVRPQIARALTGEPVWYPEANPAPPVADFRAGLAAPARFFQAIAELGIEIV